MFDDIAWPALSACTFAHWSPGIGDPTFMGWATVAVYLLTALWSIGLALQRARPKRIRQFWAVLGLLLAFLSLNKQLDLQSLLTATGRCVAKSQGWYDARRAAQLHFIIGLLLAVGVGMSLCAWMMRRHLHEIGLALIGLTAVLAFVGVRAIGFHHVDALINSRVTGVRANWVLELSGPALIALNAALSGRRSSRRRVRQPPAHRSGGR